MTEDINPQPQVVYGGISKYWQIVVGVIVAALAIGKALSVLDMLQKQDEFRKSSMEEQEQRIDDLEEVNEYNKGYNSGYQQAVKDMKNDKP